MKNSTVIKIFISVVALMFLVGFFLPGLISDQSDFSVLAGAGIASGLLLLGALALNKFSKTNKDKK